jgi:hypothetical protein
VKLVCLYVLPDVSVINYVLGYWCAFHDFIVLVVSKETPWRLNWKIGLRVNDSAIYHCWLGRFTFSLEITEGTQTSIATPKTWNCVGTCHMDTCLTYTFMYLWNLSYSGGKYKICCLLGCNMFSVVESQRPFAKTSYFLNQWWISHRIFTLLKANS